ncbi:MULTISPECIES: glutamate synthase-related protein [Flexistipes]|uniref:Ferredoxin-dependent glutamate synthase n=2 Tax=Flexistipes sinusarabici TaxID=2352 RepID=F8E439_FLESM|nr:MULTISPECIES: glutamate synthase-related protein [Flexistipes]AEI14392.1 ferredoxin-dependent glutamate synthase [Flexistipes sinusarabici DSM 4947]MEC9492999.1 glutamate synthase-related protein [Flexistipes sp.]
MNYLKSNDALGTVNRGNPAESGLCTLCLADCKGKCETWLSSIRGRKMLYPRDFGESTSGSLNTNHVGVSYSNLRIQGYLYGSEGIPAGLTNDPDDCIFPNASTETEFGAEVKTKVKVPFITGALGSTFIAEKYWDSMAIGAALVGFPIVIGENVVGVDQESEIKNGKIVKAPELDRRINSFLRYYDGYGAVIVQMNVEDTRNGVAEYLIEKFGDKVILELKWGQGAKCIGGEIQVNDLDYAIFLKNRGYIVDPDPTKKENQEAFYKHAITSFARHSRLGFTDLDSPDAVHDFFVEEVARLRKLGFERITLKTGAYGMRELAMAVKLASEAGLDLLTIDGSGGGTGMSPWNMMESWGVPSIHLHSKAYEYAKIVKEKTGRVVDLSFGGGFANEDQIFKSLALGAPFAKLACMGRSMMIPAFLGSNIEGAIHKTRKNRVFGHWDKLPSSITQFGAYPEEIFANYYEVEEKVGKDEMRNIPFGAIGVWTLCDKLKGGIQQFMSGARKFALSEISRDDIMSGNTETAEVTKIPFMTEINDEAAKEILKK